MSQGHYCGHHAHDETGYDYYGSPPPPPPTTYEEVQKPPRNFCVRHYKWVIIAVLTLACVYPLVRLHFYVSDAQAQQEKDALSARLKVLFPSSYHFDSFLYTPESVALIEKCLMETYIREHPDHAQTSALRDFMRQNSPYTKNPSIEMLQYRRDCKESLQLTLQHDLFNVIMLGDVMISHDIQILASYTAEHADILRAHVALTLQRYWDNAKQSLIDHLKLQKISLETYVSEKNDQLQQVLYNYYILSKGSLVQKLSLALSLNLNIKVPVPSSFSVWYTMAEPGEIVDIIEDAGAYPDIGIPDAALFTHISPQAVLNYAKRIVDNPNAKLRFIGPSHPVPTLLQAIQSKSTLDRQNAVIQYPDDKLPPDKPTTYFVAGSITQSRRPN